MQHVRVGRATVSDEQLDFIPVAFGIGLTVSKPFLDVLLLRDLMDLAFQRQPRIRS